jgi:hypothetical protein
VLSSESVFYHEDNYCVIELLPIQTIFPESQSIGEIGNDSEINYIDQRFTEINDRSVVKYPLARLKINQLLFESLLKEDALFFFDTVYTGYSSYREIKTDTHAFGYENYVIYYTAVEGTVILSWVDYNSLSDTMNEQPIGLKKALYKIGVLYKLMLVDWGEGIFVNLSKENDIAKYIKEIL